MNLKIKVALGWFGTLLIGYLLFSMTKEFITLKRILVTVTLSLILTGVIFWVVTSRQIPEDATKRIKED